MSIQSNSKSRRIDAVLFDLDGTLLDTARDMGNALNAILTEDGLPSLPHDYIRSYVSDGAMALVKLGYKYDKSQAELQLLWSRLIDYYRHHLSVYTCYFDGINEVIESIESSNRKWGIVTNKPTALMEPLAEQIGLSTRTSCIVSGDTLKEKKPSPAPLLHACHLLAVEPNRTIYIGDHQRDIEAGINARMLTLISAYGYIGVNTKIHQWGAHGIIYQPQQIHDWLN